MRRDNKQGGSILFSIINARIIFWALFVVVVILQLTTDPNDDFSGYYKDNLNQPTTMPKSTIKVDTAKAKKLRGDDPNNPEYADPTDLQAEDEGSYEDNSEDFNGKLR